MRPMTLSTSWMISQNSTFFSRGPRLSLSRLALILSVFILGCLQSSLVATDAPVSPVVPSITLTNTWVSGTDNVAWTSNVSVVSATLAGFAATPTPTWSLKLTGAAVNAQSATGLVFYIQPSLAAGTYTLHVDGANSAGISCSADTSIRLISPTLTLSGFTAAPSSEIWVGNQSSATLATSSVSGDEQSAANPISYRWFRKNTSTGNWDPRPNQIFATLSNELAAQFADGNQVQVIATKAGASITSTNYLTVHKLSAPSCTITPTRSGSNLNLTCNLPVNYQLASGQALSFRWNEQGQSASLGTSASLSLAVNPAMIGKVYECNVTVTKSVVQPVALTLATSSSLWSFTVSSQLLLGPVPVVTMTGLTAGAGASTTLWSGPIQAQVTNAAAIQSANSGVIFSWRLVKMPGGGLDPLPVTTLATVPMGTSYSLNGMFETGTYNLIATASDASGVSQDSQPYELRLSVPAMVNSAYIDMGATTTNSVVLASCLGAVPAAAAVQWQKRLAAGDGWSDLAGLNDRNLTGLNAAGNGPGIAAFTDGLKIACKATVGTVGALSSEVTVRRRSTIAATVDTSLPSARISLTCTPASPLAMTPTYAWLKGANLIAGATSATYAFVPTVADFSTTFTCRVTVNGASLDSDHYTLSPALALGVPLITMTGLNAQGSAQIWSGATAVNANAVVSPLIFPGVTLAWTLSRNGSVMDTLTGSTYSLRGSVAAGTYSLQVRATDALGNIQTSAAQSFTLTVPALALNQTSIWVGSTENHQSHLATCSISPSVSGATYQWQKLAGANNWIDIPHQTRSYLSNVDASTNFQGVDQVRCKVTKSGVYLTSQILTVNVLKLPKDGEILTRLKPENGLIRLSLSATMDSAALIPQGSHYGYGWIVDNNLVYSSAASWAEVAPSSISAASKIKCLINHYSADNTSVSVKRVTLNAIAPSTFISNPIVSLNGTVLTPDAPVALDLWSAAAFTATVSHSAFPNVAYSWRLAQEDTVVSSALNTTSPYQLLSLSGATLGESETILFSLGCTANDSQNNQAFTQLDIQVTTPDLQLSPDTIWMNDPHTAGEVLMTSGYVLPTGAIRSWEKCGSSGQWVSLSGFAGDSVTYQSGLLAVDDQLRCRVAKDGVAVVSDPVNVRSRPTITSVVSANTAAVDLTCIPAAWQVSPMTFSWSIDGILDPAAVTATYHFTQSAARPGARIVCTVNGTESQPFSMTSILSAPQITLNSQDLPEASRAIDLWTAASFGATVSVSVYPGVTYRWNVTDSAGLIADVATMPFAFTPGTTPLDQGTTKNYALTCTATDRKGFMSATTKTIQLRIPAVTCNPTSIWLNGYAPGANLVTATPTAGNAIQWQKQASGAGTWTTLSGANTAVLHQPVTGFTLGDRLRCAVTKSGYLGTVVGAEVLVKERPSISYAYTNVLGQLRLTCTPSSYQTGTNTFAWTVDGLAVAGTSQVYDFTQSAFSGGGKRIICTVSGTESVPFSTSTILPDPVLSFNWIQILTDTQQMGLWDPAVFRASVPGAANTILASGYAWTLTTASGNLANSANINSAYTLNLGSEPLPAGVNTAYVLRCTVTDTKGMKSFITKTLNVTAPSLTMSLSEVYLNRPAVGATVLRCTSTVPGSSFGWQQAASVVGPWNDLPAASTPNLLDTTSGLAAGKWVRFKMSQSSGATVGAAIPLKARPVITWMLDESVPPNRLRLTCTPDASQTGNLAYSWSIDGVTDATATSSIYNLAQSATVIGKRIVCTVSGIASDPFFLSAVLPEPTLTLNGNAYSAATNPTINVWTAAVFGAAVQAPTYPTVVFQWGISSGTRGDISVNGNANSYDFAPGSTPFAAGSTNSFTITCTAVDAKGFKNPTSRQFTFQAPALPVNASVVWLNNPVKSQALITCTATPPAASTIAWQRRAANGLTWTDITGATAAALPDTISGIAAGDFIRCVITSANVAVASGEVEVKQRPQISMQIVTNVNPKQVMLTCASSIAGVQTFTWSNGSSIVANTVVNTYQFSPYGSQSGSENTSQDYVCEISTGVGGTVVKSDPYRFRVSDFLSGFTTSSSGTDIVNSSTLSWEKLGSLSAKVTDTIVFPSLTFHWKLLDGSNAELNGSVITASVASAPFRSDYQPTLLLAAGSYKLVNWVVDDKGFSVTGPQNVTFTVPTITIPTTISIGDPGDLVTGSSVATCNDSLPSGASRQWQKQDGSGTWVDIYQQNATVLSKTDNATFSAGDRIRCVFASGGISVSSNVATLIRGLVITAQEEGTSDQSQSLIKNGMRPSIDPTKVTFSASDGNSTGQQFSWTLTKMSPDTVKDTKSNIAVYTLPYSLETGSYTLSVAGDTATFPFNVYDPDISPFKAHSQVIAKFGKHPYVPGSDGTKLLDRSGVTSLKDSEIHDRSVYAGLTTPVNEADGYTLFDLVPRERICPDVILVNVLCKFRQIDTAADSSSGSDGWFVRMNLEYDESLGFFDIDTSHVFSTYTNKKIDANPLFDWPTVSSGDNGYRRSDIPLTEQINTSTVYSKLFTIGQTRDGYVRAPLTLKLRYNQVNHNRGATFQASQIQMHLFKLVGSALPGTELDPTKPAIDSTVPLPSSPN